MYMVIKIFEEKRHLNTRNAGEIVFDSEIFKAIFTLVLNEEIDSGYVKPEVIFIHSTYIKANANRKKQMKVHVPAAVKTYEE